MAPWPVQISSHARRDNVVWLSWKISVEQRVPNLPHTNEVIVTYVTAGARFHLYGFLDRLQDNAIYCDTDSVIFIQSSAEPWPIATGDKLGDMHSKFKPSEHIIEFTSGRPKYYAYGIIANEGEKTVCKVRGSL